MLIVIPSIAFLLLDIYQREIKIYVYTKTYTQKFLAAFIVIAYAGNNSKVYQQINGQILTYPYNGILLYKKEE